MCAITFYPLVFVCAPQPMTFLISLTKCKLPTRRTSEASEPPHCNLLCADVTDGVYLCVHLVPSFNDTLLEVHPP